jgi:YVTN family beta-propeller protein
MKFVLLAMFVGSVAMMLPKASFPEPPIRSHGLLLVANKGDHTMGIIDPATGKEIATVQETGITGHELVASADGKTAYVPIYGNSGVGKPGSDGRTIDVIDIATRKLVRTVDLGKGLRPHCARIGPRNGNLYITTELSDSITEFDPHTMKVLATIPTGQKESHMLIISSDGKRGYTANVGVGTVSAIDLVAHKVLAVIPISKNTQRIAISTDDKRVFTADQTKPQLAVIDTATNKVSGWIPLPAVAYGTAPTLDGKWLLVTLPDLNQVGVVDLQTQKVVRTVEVGKYPQEIEVRPDDKAAYVSCMNSKQVAEINLQTWKTDRLIEAGREVDGLAWAAEH